MAILGIPPEVNILANSTVLCFPVNIFMNCAKKQANKLIPKTLLLKISKKTFITPP